ncbi:hypothetical protein BBJ28_00026609, partial [Nothophytophthora sp. Chile5]
DRLTPKPVGPAHHGGIASTQQRQARFCSWEHFHLPTLGASALHTAVWDGSVSVVEFLLRAGQSPDSADDGGLTPIMLAVMRHNVVTMRCVFRDGLAVRRNLVVDEGGLLVTNLLLSCGAQIDLEDAQGVTPLRLAIQNQNLNVLQIVLNHHQLVATPQRHDFAGAALLLAVDYEAEEVLRFVVENEYAPVTVCDAAGETLLHRAIRRRSPQLMELLADLDPAGDNLTAVTAEGASPIHYAARFGSRREVEIVLLCFTRAFGDLQTLEAAANPLNAIDRRGVTALYVVGTLGVSSNRESGRGIADAEADADADPEDGVDSLENRDSKAQLLLQYGAQLFRPGFLTARCLAPASIASGSRVVLPRRVRRCLEIWLVGARVERHDAEGEDATHDDGQETQTEGNASLTDLCMQWVASVAFLGHSATLLTVMICAGYAHSVVPLLVELPLYRWSLPNLLRQLEEFARSEPSHELTLQLHDELLAAWRTIGS